MEGSSLALITPAYPDTIQLLSPDLISSPISGGVEVTSHDAVVSTYTINISLDTFEIDKILKNYDLVENSLLMAKKSNEEISFDTFVDIARSSKPLVMDSETSAHYYYLLFGTLLLSFFMWYCIYFSFSSSVSTCADKLQRSQDESDNTSDDAGGDMRAGQDVEIRAISSEDTLQCLAELEQMLSDITFQTSTLAYQCSVLYRTVCVLEQRMTEWEDALHDQQAEYQRDILVRKHVGALQRIGSLYRKLGVYVLFLQQKHNCSLTEKDELCYMPALDYILQGESICEFVFNACLVQANVSTLQAFYELYLCYSCRALLPLNESVALVNEALDKRQKLWNNVIQLVLVYHLDTAVDELVDVHDRSDVLVPEAGFLASYQEEVTLYWVSLKRNVDNKRDRNSIVEATPTPLNDTNSNANMDVWIQQFNKTVDSIH